MSRGLREYSSTLETDFEYTPSDCFETFPFPRIATDCVEASRDRVYLTSTAARSCSSRQEGLTKTYNRFHDPDESAADIQKLRDLHVEMDKAVAAAYGWPTSTSATASTRPSRASGSRSASRPAGKSSPAS